MSTDLEQQFADAYPPTGIQRPAAEEFWELGQEHRRHRRSAGVLAGTGVATLLVVVAATSALTLPGTDLPAPVISGGDHDVADEEPQAPAMDTDEWSDVAAMLSADNPAQFDDSHGSVEALWDTQIPDRERLCAWADTIAEREGTEAVQDIDVWATAIMELTGEDRALAGSAEAAGGWCGYLPDTTEVADDPDDWSDVADMLSPDEPQRYDYATGNVDTLWYERVRDDLDRLCAWADTIAEREGIPQTRDVADHPQDTEVWVDAITDLTGAQTAATRGAASTVGAYCGYLG